MGRVVVVHLPKAIGILRFPLCSCKRRNVIGYTRDRENSGFRMAWEYRRHGKCKGRGSSRGHSRRGAGQGRCRDGSLQPLFYYQLAIGLDDRGSTLGWHV